MDKPRKLPGGKCGPATQLKLLPREQQDLIWSWREEKVGEDTLTNKQIRERIAERFKINIGFDTYISRFWKWYEARQASERLNEVMERYEENLRSRNGDWQPEKIRDACIQHFLERATEKDDADTFALILKVDQKERFSRAGTAQKDRQLGQEDRKVTVLEQKAAAYDRAQAALTEAKSSNGVITPETLRRIEEELRLL